MVNPFRAMQVMQSPSQALIGQMLGRFRQQDPQKFQMIQQMVSGKDDGQLREMAMNLAKEKGVDLNQFAGQVGIKI